MTLIHQLAFPAGVYFPYHHLWIVETGTNKHKILVFKNNLKKQFSNCIPVWCELNIKPFFGGHICSPLLGHEWLFAAGLMSHGAV